MINIFQNKKWWSTLSAEELQSYIDDVFSYYRQNGYPYYDLDIDNELVDLVRSGNAKIDKKIIQQKMVGLGLAWSYHPHAVAVRNGDSLSPLEVFNDDKLFRKCIEKRIKYGDNISDAAIRKSLRKYGGIGVSNFRPTSASAIYDYFKAKVVWDMSGGYGGRMLGAWMSKSVETYIATEPCTKTFIGLARMGVNLQSRGLKKFKVALYREGSEVFVPQTRVDLCFTSPPYFDQERYSDEPTQSYIRFPTYDEWMKGFMGGTLRNCIECLQSDGRIVVNIANTKKYPTMEKDFLDLCGSLGLVLEDTLLLQLSAREHYSKDTSFKYEPVFILKIGKSLK